MGLFIEPKSRKSVKQFFLLFVIILCGVGLVWWRRDQLITGGATPSRINVSRLEQRVSNADIVSTTETKAFTAEFYVQAEEAEGELSTNQWQGIQGRTELVRYIVKSGDTLWSIAYQFGLDIDTLRWSNPALARNPDILALDSELIILPVIGAYHVVEAGETVEAIAAQYGVGVIDILNYPLNQLTSTDPLKPGKELIIPNGRKNVVLLPPALDEDYPLAWPLQGYITQGYHANHLALDFSAPYGSSVYAAAAGKVVYAQWARTGYGFTVILDHGDSRQTLYSHLKGALVQVGQWVERGQIIGEVGSTGNSTGPHVHFEVRENNQRVNPRDYLR